MPLANIHRDVGISGTTGTQGRQGWHQLDGRLAGSTGSSAPAGSGGGWTRTVPPLPRGGSSTWEPSLGEMRAPGWRYEPLPSRRWTG